jgi:serine/threonine-protein kinase
VAPGVLVGPYEVLGCLGSGGMGDVYLGRDERLHRKVALKCLRPAPPGSEAHEGRILREARAAARVSHPNIATVYDVLEQAGRAFIVMEFVDGESLAVRLTRGRLPLRDVLAIGQQLASALVAAHAEGVIHRDLKPANVQVTSTGVVKVLDFGLAHAPAPVAAPPSAVTASAQTETIPGGRWAGTPAYMAPEQVLGAAANERADIYSLGVILFEMATGRRPYDRIEPMALVSAPGSLAPRADEIEPGVPAGLADLIARALRCNPNERFASAADLAGSLAELEALQPLPARWTRRVGLGMLVATAVILPIVLWMRDAQPPSSGPPPASTIAVLPFANLSNDPARDFIVDGFTDGLINALGRISALRVKARRSVMQYKLAKASIGDIARDLQSDLVVEGSVMPLVNGTQVRMTLNVIDPHTQTSIWSDAREFAMRETTAVQADIALAIARNLHVAVTPEEQRRLARTAPVDPDTFSLYLLGRQEWNGRTVPHLNRALSYFQQAVGRSPDYGPAHAGLADTYVLLAGDFGVLPRDEGAALAIASASRALSLDPTLAEAHTSLAFANFFLLWNWEAADEQFQRALELNPSYATARHWYGNYLSDLGREDAALTEIRRALEIDPHSPIINRDVAWPLFHSGRYDEAVAHLDQVLAKFPGYLAAERLRARALSMRGDVEDALRQFQEQHARDPSPRSRCELAWAYARAGRKDAATRELRAALAAERGLYYYDVAVVYAALGRSGEALEALRRAIDERDPTMVNVKHDPRLASLRGDPRYARLLAQMRFP